MWISTHCNNLKLWDVNRIRNEEDKQLDQQIVTYRATRNRENWREKAYLIKKKQDRKIFWENRKDENTSK